MNHQKNQKYQRTHLAIQEALLDLSKHTDTVTVSDICRRCHINRSAFYLHYEDLRDLLKEIQKRMSVEILRLYEQAGPKAQVPFSKESYCIFSHHVKENQDYYRIFFKLNTSFPISEGFERAWESVLVPYFNQKQIYDEEHMLMRFICFQAGFTHVLKQWVDSACSLACEDIAAIIFECLHL